MVEDLKERSLLLAGCCCLHLTCYIMIFVLDSCGTPFFVSARKAREPLHRIAMHLHAERFREFLSFIEDIAREDAGKTVPGKAALMRRWRGRATFQLDRCYLFVGCMVHSFGNDAELLLLFALLFVTVG